MHRALRTFNYPVFPMELRSLIVWYETDLPNLNTRTTHHFTHEVSFESLTIMYCTALGLGRSHREYNIDE